jgi:hypothetical protein
MRPPSFKTEHGPSVGRLPAQPIRSNAPDTLPPAHCPGPRQIETRSGSQRRNNGGLPGSAGITGSGAPSPALGVRGRAVTVHRRAQRGQPVVSEPVKSRSIDDPQGHWAIALHPIRVTTAPLLPCTGPTPAGCASGATKGVLSNSDAVKECDLPDTAKRNGTAPVAAIVGRVFSRRC